MSREYSALSFPRVDIMDIIPQIHYRARRGPFFFRGCEAFFFCRSGSGPIGRQVSTSVHEGVGLSAAYLKVFGNSVRCGRNAAVLGRQTTLADQRLSPTGGA